MASHRSQGEEKEKEDEATPAASNSMDYYIGTIVLHALKVK